MDCLMRGGFGGLAGLVPHISGIHVALRTIRSTAMSRLESYMFSKIINMLNSSLFSLCIYIHFINMV